MLRVVDSHINRFSLCNTVAKAARRLHRPGTRVESTIQHTIQVVVKQSLLENKANINSSN